MQSKCQIFGISPEYSVFSRILGILKNIRFRHNIRHLESAEYSVSADSDNLGFGRSLTQPNYPIGCSTLYLYYGTRIPRGSNQKATKIAVAGGDGKEGGSEDEELHVGKSLGLRRNCSHERGQVVRQDFTPERSWFCMLLERLLSVFSRTSLEQHKEYWL